MSRWRNLNSFYIVGLLAFLGTIVLRRWGHDNLDDFAEGTLLGMAVLFMLVGVYRARHKKS